MERRFPIILLVFVAVTLLIYLLTLEMVYAKVNFIPTADQPFPAAPVSQPTAVPGLAGLNQINAFTETVDCNQLTPPIIGYETSKGQGANDIAGLLTDLVTLGYSAGSVDINAGSIPSCVDVLLVRGLAGNVFLPAAYSAAEGTTLRNWVSGGHGLLVASDFGAHADNTQALFQAFGYTLANGAVTDSDDFDSAGPFNYWVIYQSDNFNNHPILNGVNTFELLASSWFTLSTNAIVTTDNNATANPANIPVLAAFDQNQGCVVLSADSNWMADSTNGYLKADNALVAQQMVNWLNGCFSLSLRKSASTNSAQPGQLVTFTIQAANYDSTPLTGVQITDTVPAGTSFVSASSPHRGPDGRGVVTWDLGTLDAASTAAVELVVQLNGGLANGTVVANTAFVVSSQGLSDSATALVSVNASGPTAVSGGPYEVNEGSTVLLDGRGSMNPGSAPLSYAWDLDNDGLFDDASGATAVFSAAARDDGVFPVGLRVDNGALTDTSATAVTVLNVAPQAAFTATSWQILIGQTVTFTGSFNDPGTLDTHTISWDFGDSSVIATGSLNQSHQYAAAGQYTVSLTVADDDDGLDEVVHSINVVDAFRQYLPYVTQNACQDISTPADIILAIDVSSSMDEPATGGGTRLDAAKEAADTFINLLDFAADQAGIVSFGNSSTLQHPLSVNRNSLLNTLYSLTTNGATRMDLALVTSRQELTGPRAKSTNTPVVILLTDGKPNGATPEEVLAEANLTKAAGILIYTIGLGDDANVSLMQNMATTPNHYYQAPTTAELIGIYEQIANRIQCHTAVP